MNKIFLIGRIGRVEVKTFQSGEKVVLASLATSLRYTDRNGEKREQTEWHNLVINGKLADVAERYVTKGDLLSVVGRMTYRKYTNSNGVEVSSPEVRVEELELMPKPSAAASEAKPAAGSAAPQGSDDLPF